MGNWEFSASAYFVNAYWASWLNESYWEVPEVTTIDECGPPNIISPGYALWLALVPAVGCAVQLPGSTFLYRRSNFYRFAPEIGLADCVATVALIGKALFRGYRLKESVAAVLLVREGVGAGDLWWRVGGESEHGIATSNGTTPTTASTVIVTSSDEENESSDEEVPNGEELTALPQSTDAQQHLATAHREGNDLEARLEPYDHPISTERIIGSSLFILALIKTITMLATTPGSPSVRLATCIALSYSFSFIVFEALLWSLAFVSPGYSLSDVPIDNLLGLLRIIDPGDNPFTFPAPVRHQNHVASGSDVELQSNSTVPNEPTTSSVPWNKAVALCAALTLVFGLLIWVLLLRSIWLSNKPIFILAITALAYFVVRLIWTLMFSQHPASVFKRLVHAGNLPARLQLSRLKASTNLFIVTWVVERTTTVNLFSALWLVMIVGYYSGSFGQLSKEKDDLLLKPLWLDWL